MVWTRAKTLRIRRGFTLMEVALATTIVGTGFVAMLALLAAGTRVTSEGAEQTSAVMLVRNIREYTLGMSYADVQALNNRTFSPPIDSRGSAIAALSGWSQRVTVQPVHPDQLGLNQVDDDPDAIRVTVTIRRRGIPTTTEHWYSFKPLPVP